MKIDFCWRYKGPFFPLREKSPGCMLRTIVFRKLQEGEEVKRMNSLYCVHSFQQKKKMVTRFIFFSVALHQAKTKCTQFATTVQWLDRPIIPSMNFLWLQVVCQVDQSATRSPPTQDILTSPSRWINDWIFLNQRHFHCPKTMCSKPYHATPWRPSKLHHFVSTDQLVLCTKFERKFLWTFLASRRNGGKVAHTCGSSPVAHTTEVGVWN